MLNLHKTFFLMKHPIFISAQFWNKHFMGFWFVKMLRREAENINFIIFGGNSQWSNPCSTTLQASTQTTTPLESFRCSMDIKNITYVWFGFTLFNFFFRIFLHFPIFSFKPSLAWWYKIFDFMVHMKNII